MPDTVLALVSRTNLNGMLSAFHRAGYGSVIRVLDPERAPVPDQLNRAGVAVERVGRCSDDDVVVFVHAPKRTGAAAAIAVATGAIDVELSLRTIGINDTAPAGIIQSAQKRRARYTRRPESPLPHWADAPIAAD